jgi:hypothetical protein
MALQVSISSVASSAKDACRLTGYPSFWVILHIQESRNKGSLCRVVVCWIMVSTRCLNAKPSGDDDDDDDGEDQLIRITGTATATRSISQHNTIVAACISRSCQYLASRLSSAGREVGTVPRGSVDTEEVFVEWSTRLVACAEMAVGENGPARDSHGGSISAQTHGSVGPGPRRLWIRLASGFDPKDVRLGPS